MEGVMWRKLAALVAFCPWLLFGCGLETSGSGPDGDDQSPSDVPEEESGPDIPGDEVPDVAEDRFDLTEEDVSPEAADEAGPDEDGEAADEAADSAEAEDAGPEEDGAGEDGEATDPCAPPEIPPVGLYLWYCIPDPPVRIVLSAARWVDTASGPDVPWTYEPGCSERDTRSLFCEMADYGAGSVWYFNIVTPGIGVGWSCGPGLAVTHGTPRVWHSGWELEVTAVDNGEGGCNHSFWLAPL